MYSTPRFRITSTENANNTIMRKPGQNNTTIKKPLGDLPVNKKFEESKDEMRKDLSGKNDLKEDLTVYDGSSFVFDDNIFDVYPKKTYQKELILKIMKSYCHFEVETPLLEVDDYLPPINHSVENLNESDLLSDVSIDEVPFPTLDEDFDLE